MVRCSATRKTAPAAGKARAADVHDKVRNFQEQEIPREPCGRNATPEQGGAQRIMQDGTNGCTRPGERRYGESGTGKSGAFTGDLRGGR